MIPWFLNPWAEVRRWEREAHAQHKWALKEHEGYVAMKSVAADAINLLEKREAENADLRRRIAEMDSCESGAENCRFHQSTLAAIEALKYASSFPKATS